MKIKRIVSAVVAAVMLFTTQGIGTMQPIVAKAVANKTRASVHDPSVMKALDGTYYIFGSHIEAARSKDLQSWAQFTNGYTTPKNVLFGDLSKNLAGAFAWAGEDLEDCTGGFSVWAPDVVYNPDYINKDGSKGAYLMYFCTSCTAIRSVIAFGASKKPEGPYEYVDTLIYSGFTKNDNYVKSSTKNVNTKYTSTNVDELIDAGKVTLNNSWFSGSGFNKGTFPNAIDPTIYTSTDGKMYMTYGSWSGGIFTIEIDKTTGKCIHPKSGNTADGRMVDSYFGTKISGGNRKSGEGPFVEYNPDNGYYYLWVTYGGLASEGGYNMRVFRSKNPDGPFTDPAGNPAVLGSSSSLNGTGLKVMGNYKFSSLNTAYMAPGHNSVIREDDGSWYLVYHTRFDDGYEFHQVRVHSMFFNSEDWPVVAPYEYSGDVIAEGGYQESDIVGDYEFINHGTDTSKTIHSYVNIQLKADGTITGGATGTWSQAEDSPKASFMIGTQRYDGVFLVAQDETGKEKQVMSFTAVGSNNQTIWGVQTKKYTGTERAGLTDYTNADSKLVYSPDTALGTNDEIRIGDTELLSGVSYFISNKNSGMLLETKDGKSDAGTNIQQWEMNKGSHHEWRIVDLGNGYCRISLMSNEQMAVTVDGTGAEDGLNVKLAVYTGNDNQQFKLVADGAYYGIVSKTSADKSGLDVFEWSTENGGNIAQWEFWGGDCQLWKISPVHPAVNDGSYTLKNINSGKYIATSNSNVVQTGASANWEIKNHGNGICSIINQNNQAITVVDGSAEDGADISVSEYTGATSQKFRMRCNADGSYTILTEASAGVACLDVFEALKDEGTKICQWNAWGSDGQKFVIEPTIGRAAQKVVGDVNADGAFTIADLDMMQNFLLNRGNLTDWTAGDLCNDNQINAYDMACMKRIFTANK